MHVSLKQIQMLMTFDKYNLLLLYDNNHYIYMLKYVIKEINLLFFKYIQMIRHKSKGKGRKGMPTHLLLKRLRHARACPLTCLR
jgi:hypothetical protein